MARRRTRWSFSVLEALEERVVQSSATAAHPATSAIVSTESTKTTTLPVQANFSTPGIYTLNAATGASGPNEMQIEVDTFSGSLNKIGFDQVEGVLVARQNNASADFQTTGTIELLGAKGGTIDLLVHGPDINVNNGPLGLVSSTTRLDYTLANGTGSFANVTGTGRMNVVTLGYFETAPTMTPGESIRGNLDVTLLPDRRDRATPLPTRLSGSISVMKRSETIASGLSGTQIVDDVGGAGKISPLGNVKITGNFDQPNSNPATADTTGEFTLTNTQGSVTLEFTSLGSTTTSRPVRKYAVTIIDSTGAYAGATGTATAMLIPVKNLSYTLQFVPGSAS